jgi:hypothetical protein
MGPRMEHLVMLRSKISRRIQANREDKGVTGTKKEKSKGAHHKQ